jgi:phosphoglycolate phosphatase
MNCRGVIFDLDGTLLNTLEDIVDSMNTVLSRFCFPEHSIASYKYFIGDGMEKLVSRCLPADQREASVVTRCVAAMREEYGKRWSNKTHAYEGIPELLDTLTLRGIRLAILSNKPDEFTKVVVAKFLTRWKFESVVGSKPSVPKKPDPKAALEIAAVLEIPSSEILFLGDSGIDMETASAANMYAVGVLWGFRTANELRASGAKALLEKPADLVKLM